MKTKEQLKAEILGLRKERIELTKRQIALGSAGAEYNQLVFRANEIGSEIRRLELAIEFAK